MVVVTVQLRAKLVIIALIEEVLQNKVRMPKANERTVSGSVFRAPKHHSCGPEAR